MELKLFNSNQIKKTYVPLKLVFNGKKLYPTRSVKYLGIRFAENLNWKQQISNLAIKLNKTNATLSKSRYLTGKHSEQYIMQNLNHIYIILLLFGLTVQIQLKGFLFCRRNPYDIYIFLVTLPTHHIYSKNTAS